MTDIKENDVLKKLNSVDYKFAPDFGLVVSRQYISQNSSQVSYPCGTERSVPVEFEINISEADYVDGQKSYLSFEIKTNHDGDAQAGYGSGSALNVIKRVQLISSDGQTIDDLGNINQYHIIAQRWKKPNEYFTKSGKVSGHGSRPGGSYAIPLDFIPFFKYRSLIPSSIVNSMKVRFELDAPENIIKDSAGRTDWVVDVNKPKLVLNTYTLDHKLHSTIKDAEIEYPSYKHQNRRYNTQNAKIPLNYTVSKAVKAFGVTRTIPPTDSFKFISDGLVGDAYDLVKWRWRVGNKMNPSQPVTTVSESYMQSFTALDSPDDISVGLDEFVSTFNNVSLDLRRTYGSQMMGGTPIDNSNLLEIHLNHTSATDKEINLFVPFMKRLIVQDGKLAIFE